MAEPLAALVEDWSFVPGQPSLRRRLRALEGYLRRSQPRPRSVALRRLRPAPRAWTGYVMFSPDGRLQPHQRYTLQRLRDEGQPVCAVVASAQPSNVDAELLALCDAVYWKDLAGYDFSGYQLLLNEVATLDAGNALLLLNDSVFGPLRELAPVCRRMRWDLSGITAAGQVENHIQSYAMRWASVSPALLQRLNTLWVPGLCLRDRLDVILCQETRLSRLAARDISVGSVWFDAQLRADPTLFRPFDLLQRGFPFVKRSLFGRYGHLADQDAIADVLAQAGHPVPRRTALPAERRPC